MVLVCGGANDPNIDCLVFALKRRKAAYRTLLIGDTGPGAFEWDIQSNILRTESGKKQYSAAFIRYDVFNNLIDNRPESQYRASCWYSGVASWLSANSATKVLNRRFGGHVFKPHVLKLAQDFKLSIPRTLITNAIDELEKKITVDDWIVKPINGGDYCQSLASVLKSTRRISGAAAAPAIVQERLVPPEVRIYRVGEEYFCFSIKSDALDYRTTSDCSVEPVFDVSPRLLRKLGRLTDALRLDFMAADFKTCPRSGDLKFLEVNSGPMFSAFDAAGKGSLTDAMSRFLVG